MPFCATLVSIASFIRSSGKEWVMSFSTGMFISAHCLRNATAVG